LIFIISYVNKERRGWIKHNCGNQNPSPQC